MTPLDALIELLALVGVCQGATALVNNEELGQWPVEAVSAMKAQKLLVKARPASSAGCQGCEQDCTMPVHTLTTATGATASFIVCDKRSDTNRVPVPSEKLVQWRCNASAVCGFVAVSLGLRLSDKSASDGLWVIGMAAGDTRSQMLCLQAGGELTLIAGDNKLPLAELVEFHDGRYSIEGSMVRRMVDAATTADERYTPTIVKQEARKLKTKAMYADWQKACRTLQRNKPGMGDVWYSQQIAKMDIAQGRDAGTIRKHMKK